MLMNKDRFKDITAIVERSHRTLSKERTEESGDVPAHGHELETLVNVQQLFDRLVLLALLAANSACCGLIAAAAWTEMFSQPIQKGTTR